MSYELVYTRRAVHDIEALDAVVKKRLAKKLLLLQERPRELSRKLIHHAIGSYRYRVGDHRVVFDLIGKRIVILRVGHRSGIYR